MQQYFCEISPICFAVKLMSEIILHKVFEKSASNPNELTRAIFF
mgnify:CR=1 FL=1